MTFNLKVTSKINIVFITTLQWMNFFVLSFLYFLLFMFILIYERKFDVSLEYLLCLTRSNNSSLIIKKSWRHFIYKQVSGDVYIYNKNKNTLENKNETYNLMWTWEVLLKCSNKLRYKTWEKTFILDFYPSMEWERKMTLQK